MNVPVTIRIGEKTVDCTLGDVRLGKLLEVLGQASQITIDVYDTSRAGRLVAELITPPVPAPANLQMEFTAEQMVFLAQPINERFTPPNRQDMRITRALWSPERYRRGEIENPQAESLRFMWEVCRFTRKELLKRPGLGHLTLDRLEEVLSQNELKLGLKDRIDRVREHLPKRNR